MKQRDHYAALQTDAAGGRLRREREIDGINGPAYFSNASTIGRHAANPTAAKNLHYMAAAQRNSVGGSERYVPKGHQSPPHNKAQTLNVASDHFDEVQIGPNAMEGQLTHGQVEDYNANMGNEAMAAREIKEMQNQRTNSPLQTSAK